MNRETAEWCKSLPKPGDREGWNKRMDEMFGQILGNIPRPVTPELEPQK